jgi:hypothetical protein
MSGYIQLDGFDLDREIHHGVQRHSHQRYDDQRLEHTSSWRPLSPGVLVITTNTDRYSSKKDQSPKNASNPSPFQYGLQVIFVQKSPRPRHLVAPTGIVYWEHNAKRPWAKPE